MSEQIIVLTAEDVKQSPDKVIDIIANLARRVTQLESQLRATQRNLETWAEQTESNSEDIRLLDDRTQSLTHTQRYYSDKSAGVEFTVEMILDDIVGISERIKKIGGAS